VLYLEKGGHREPEHLARKSDQISKWLPDTPEGLAEVQQWLSVAVYNLASGPALLRAIKIFKMSMASRQIDPLSIIPFNGIFNSKLELFCFQ